MKHSIRAGIAASIGMIALILDSKTALLGAKEGVLLCASTVIPSLFPFMILSSMITRSIAGRNISILRPIGKLCGIPRGAEAILITGLIGGYPIGAKCIGDACKSGQLSKEDAQRMLGFCSNAGPSFLFGILSMKFPSPRYVWILWGIIIFSAVITGMLLPEKRQNIVMCSATVPQAQSKLMDNSIKAMAGICGWVIVFRVILTVSQRWCFWLLPEDMQTIISGMLELTNGCCDLENIQNLNHRFVAAAGMLSFGGLCVMMQTTSVIPGLGIRYYIRGKILQTIISVFLAQIVSLFLFPWAFWDVLLPFLPVILLLLTSIFIIFRKNNVNRGRNSEMVHV